MRRRKAGLSLLRPFFLWFNRIFFRVRDKYQALVGHMLTRNSCYLLVYLLIVAALGFLFHRMPTAYLPDEDQGILFAQVLMPTGSTRADPESRRGGPASFFGE